MDRRTFVIAGAAALVVPASPLSAQGCPGFGRFIGDLDLRALDGGRKMKLLKPYRYVDTGGLVWSVPEGVELDGASIPQVFTSITGGPWDGPYRNASVIHDWYCVSRSRRWEAVHRMFYEAMLANCTPGWKAGIMYAAVWTKGPRWAAPNRLNARLSAQMGALASDFVAVEADRRPPPAAPDMTVEAFQALAARIERENLGAAQIEALVGG